MKKIIFISHITEEKELAIKTKELIEQSFLGMIEVFVSSDENSISLGQKWLDKINDSLQSCAIEIILCSPASIKRPWINFEAGAGWIRGIPVIPLCHSNLSPSKLPMPLVLLQGTSANSSISLELLFPVLAETLGSAVPKVNFSDYTSFVLEFEKKYTFWNKLNNHFKELNNIEPQLIPAFKNQKGVQIDFTETQINKIEGLLPFLTSEGILKGERMNSTSIGPGGTTYGYQITLLGKMEEVLNDDKFEY
jgi:hypothetical protein